MGLTEQFLLNQSDELLLNSSDILVAHVLEPGPNVAFENNWFWHFIPVNIELPEVHLILGNFIFQCFDSLNSSLFFFHVNFLVVQLR